MIATPELAPLFDGVEPRKAATRNAYGEALLELGASNPEVVVLDADLSGSTKTKAFGKAHPDRVEGMHPIIRTHAQGLTVALNTARDLLLGRAGRRSGRGANAAG